MKISFVSWLTQFTDHSAHYLADTMTTFFFAGIVALFFEQFEPGTGHVAFIAYVAACVPSRCCWPEWERK